MLSRKTRHIILILILSVPVMGLYNNCVPRGFQAEGTMSSNSSESTANNQNEGETNTPPGTSPQAELIPISLEEVSNPHPQNHPRFTAALSSPHLYWADSLRPDPNGTEAEKNRYYGARRGDSGKYADNPRLSYDANEDAAKQIFLIDEMGIPLTYQTRIKWPAVGPNDADLFSIQWQIKESINGFQGGKQFQIAAGAGGDKLHFEFKNLLVLGELGSPNWGRSPHARVYVTDFVGLRGLNDILVGGSSDPNSPDYCSGVLTCPLQPAMPSRFSARSSNYSWDDHLQQYFLTTHDVWYTVTVTFDWRDKSNHKVWMHLEGEGMPKMLVIGTPSGDGYPVNFSDALETVGGWWIEFNNSTTINDRNSHGWIRNLIVFKDAFVP